MPVFDQYEVETSSAYSGSFTDQVMFGDMFVNAATLITGYTPLGQPNPKTSRRLIASRVAGKESTYPNINNMWIPGYMIDGYATGSWMGRAQRFQPFFSEESWLDSYMPNPVDITLANGNQLYGYSMNATSYDTSGSAFGIDPIAEEPSVEIGFTFQIRPTSSLFAGPVDSVWNFSYPFQSKYKTIQKLFSFSKKLPQTYIVNTNFDGTSITPPSSSNYIGSISTGFQRTAVSVGYNILFGYMNIPGSVWPPNGLSVLKPGNPDVGSLFKLFFGIGKGGASSIGKYYSSPEYKIVIPIGGINYCYNLIPRGYKYGIRSATPEQTKCIYRLGRYGQFRDMLEGRPTVAYSPRTGGIVFPAYIPTYISFKSGTLIYEQSRDYVSATNPSYNPYDSGIYDQYYRSGQPFFDRDNED